MSSFADALSATASATLKASRDQALATLVDEFKAECQAKAAQGYFKAEVKYKLSFGYPGVKMQSKTVAIKPCVKEVSADFEKQLNDDINALGFKNVSINVNWPDTLAAFIACGTVSINAEWSPKQNTGGPSGVKRDPFAAVDAQIGKRSRLE